MVFYYVPKIGRREKTNLFSFFWRAGELDARTSGHLLKDGERRIVLLGAACNSVPKNKIFQGLSGGRVRGHDRISASSSAIDLVLVLTYPHLRR